MKMETTSSFEDPFAKAVVIGFEALFAGMYISMGKGTFENIKRIFSYALLIWVAFEGISSEPLIQLHTWTYWANNCSFSIHDRFRTVNYYNL